MKVTATGRRADSVCLTTSVSASRTAVEVAREVVPPLRGTSGKARPALFTGPGPLAATARAEVGYGAS